MGKALACPHRSPAGVAAIAAIARLAQQAAIVIPIGSVAVPAAVTVASIEAGPLVSARAAIAALVARVLATPPFGLLIAEPRGDLVACTLEESALIIAAARAPFKAVIAPSRTLITIVVTVMCH